MWSWSLKPKKKNYIPHLIYVGCKEDHPFSLSVCVSINHIDDRSLGFEILSARSLQSAVEQWTQRSSHVPTTYI